MPNQIERRAWLKERHPIHEAWRDIWIMNERRLRGGTEVLVELVPFNWEKINTSRTTLGEELENAAGVDRRELIFPSKQRYSESYMARQKDATYINFMDMHASIISGHLMRDAPIVATKDGNGSLDFGTLGSTEWTNETPDPAFMAYNNVDGTGRYGSQWDQWWMAALKRAMATGHRWIYVDSSQEKPETVEDEINGKRPYLTELSPIVVTNWSENAGVFDFFVIKLKERQFKVKSDGTADNKAKDIYLLLVRQGYDGLNGAGDDFTAGGWWKFDEELEYVKDENNQPVHGEWTSTKGEIPLFPFFCEQDEGSEELPSLSRPMLTPLGQVGVSYMNLSSAADYDAWDAGSSAKFIMGIHPDDHAEVVSQEKDGSKTIGVPLATDGEGRVIMPTIHDSQQGAVSSDIWDKRLKNKWDEAKVVASLESVGAPDTSGVSKQVSFAEIMGPKLSNIAANIESAQGTAIYFLEKRWGGPNTVPTGSVIWPREFNLQDIVADIQAFFQLETLSGVKNPAFAAQLLVRAAQELALETDPDRMKKLLKEYLDKASQAEEERRQMSQAFAGGGGGEGGADEEEDEEEEDAEF